MADNGDRCLWHTPETPAARASGVLWKAAQAGHLAVKPSRHGSLPSAGLSAVIVAVRSGPPPRTRVTLSRRAVPSSISQATDESVLTGKNRASPRRSALAPYVVSEEEQPDRDNLSQQAALRYIPDLLSGEMQLPSGEGLPPISQPILEGMEPDLPVRQRSYDPQSGKRLD